MQYATVCTKIMIYYCLTILKLGNTLQYLGAVYNIEFKIQPANSLQLSTMSQRTYNHVLL
jgi:hypothetical protein